MPIFRTDLMLERQPPAPRSFSRKELFCGCLIVGVVMSAQVWIIAMMDMSSSSSSSDDYGAKIKIHHKNGVTYYGNDDGPDFHSMISATNPPFHLFLYPPSIDTTTTMMVNDLIYENDVTKFIESTIPLSSSSSSSFGSMFAKRMASNAGTTTVTDDDNATAATTTPATDEDSDRLWAVDIGANVGFHAHHMAARGARVIAFEASHDTANLLRTSALGNGFLRDVDELPSHDDGKNATHDGDDVGDNATTTKTKSSSSLRSFYNKNPTKGSITVIEAGASDELGVGHLSRHPKSPGFTSLTNDTETFGLVTSNANVTLMRADSILENLIGDDEDPSKLQLLKVDVEGHELQALKGLNLTRFPFQYLTFEFFPSLLESNGVEDPVDLLIYVHELGYKFLNGHDIKDELNMTTVEDVRKWGKEYMRKASVSKTFHINLFAKLSNDQSLQN